MVQRARRAVATGCAGAVLSLGTGGAALAADDESCAPWAGEISPLPTVQSRDAFLARWARLRADELAALASAVAGTDPSAAHRLWRHSLCLAPENPKAQQELAQLAPR